MNDERGDLITTFTKNPVAANLLMIVMIILGLYGLSRLNTQFLPNFSIPQVNVSIPWRGATPEDVERSVIVPVEQELQDLDFLRELKSTASRGFASFSIEFEEGADLGLAVEQIKERLDRVRNLPQDTESAQVERIIHYEPIASLLIRTDDDLTRLRPLAERFKRELLKAGIAKVTIKGLPDEEIAIEVPPKLILSLKQSLPNLSNRIADASQDIPAGTVGERETAKPLRSEDQARTVEAFRDLVIPLDTAQNIVHLRDVAEVRRQNRDDQALVKINNEAAIELSLLRTESTDALDSARILEKWLENTRPSLPDGLEIEVYQENWTLIKDRIHLLLKNGIGGLLLIIVILFVVLDGRIAFWIAVGIPVSFLAALAALAGFGGSINMVSLFALIMTLGIIVDDSIVVGEEALARLERNEPPLMAAQKAAKRMFPPVMASSLTTIAAFFPLMLVGDEIGQILFAIPLVVICVILASLLECFLVLPGHLSHSFQRKKPPKTWKIQHNVNTAFAEFRDGRFRETVHWTVMHPASALVASVCVLLFTLTLLGTGRLPFNFFPSPDGRIVKGVAEFTAGTPPETVRAYLDQMLIALENVESDLKLKNGDDEIIQQVVVTERQSAAASNSESANNGDNLGSITLELVSPDQRETTNQALVDAWRRTLTRPPGLEKLSVFAQRGGPPGGDIDIQLSGTTALALKAAAESLKTQLASFNGLYNISDNMPYGREQIIYSLTPQAKTLGLTLRDLGSQLRASLEGNLVQIFHQSEQELEVRLRLNENFRDYLANIEFIPILTPANEVVPLGSVARLEAVRGLDVLRHSDTRLSVQVKADVNASVTNANVVLAQLEDAVFPALKAEGVDVRLKGRSEEQQRTFADMLNGLIIAITLIYLILAWVFGSYSWPLAVMAIIPFGVTGALLGHWLYGIDVTILSLFGIFGLSGIVINDSIILITFFKQLRAAGLGTHEAIVQAACQRLRAVLLTSMTTIAGLTPLLFETSLQAQFLIPMAVSISFGLGFATVLVLLIVPALLAITERNKRLLKISVHRFWRQNRLRLR